MADDFEDFNGKIIREFRENGGKVGGMFDGTPLLLLHTTGARSGAERVNPVAYGRSGDDYTVFASKGGAPTSPDWYHNLVAHPQVTIEVGSETIPLTARVASGEERDRIWTAWKSANPGFADYEQKTSREIPVVILSRAS
jgi:deazaflavin-dependent oxidoreductase (nitroreductase family)